MRDRTRDVEGAPVSDQTEPRQPRTRRAKRPSVGLRVPTTSFDLLEGSAAAQVRTRALNGVLLIVAIAVIGTLLSRGAIAEVEVRGQNNDKTAVQAQSTRLQEQVRDARTSGEVSAQAVEEHIDDRLVLVREITADEIDVARIVSDLAALGPGISVTSITLGEDAAKAPEQAGGSRNRTTTTQGGIITEGVEEANKGEQAASATAIRIDGTATSQAAAASAARVLSDTSRFPYLSAGASGEVSCSSDTTGSQVCTWTWTGQLADGGLGSRTEDLVARAKQPFATSAQGGN